MQAFGSRFSFALTSLSPWAALARLRRSLPLLAVAFVALTALGACAADTTPPPAETGAEVAAPTAETTLDRRAEVRQALDDFYAAATTQDWERIGTMMASDFELYTDGAEVFDRATYLSLLEQESLEVQEMRLDDVQIEVAGDLAVATFRGYFVHGPEMTVQTAETVVFQLDGASWLMAHAHASVKVLEGGEEGGDASPSDAASDGASEAP